MAFSFDFPMSLWNVLLFSSLHLSLVFSFRFSAFQRSNQLKILTFPAECAASVTLVVGILFSCHWFNQLGVNKALKLIYSALRAISRMVMLSKDLGGKIKLLFSI